MKKSISKKMLLPILLASFCSGANASEKGVAQNRWKGSVLNSNVNVSNNAKPGFSGFAMGVSNTSSLLGGAVAGYLVGNKLQPKGPDTPTGPTQKQYDDVVAERDTLKQTLEKERLHNPWEEKALSRDMTIRDLEKQLADANNKIKLFSNGKPQLEKLNKELDEKQNTIDDLKKKVASLEKQLNNQSKDVGLSQRAKEFLCDEDKKIFNAVNSLTELIPSNIKNPESNTVNVGKMSRGAWRFLLHLLTRSAAYNSGGYVLNQSSGLPLSNDTNLNDLFHGFFFSVGETKEDRKEFELRFANLLKAVDRRERVVLSNGQDG